MHSEPLIKSLNQLNLNDIAKWQLVSFLYQGHVNPYTAHGYHFPNGNHISGITYCIIMPTRKLLAAETSTVGVLWRSPIFFSWCMNGQFCFAWRVNGDMFFLWFVNLHVYFSILRKLVLIFSWTVKYAFTYVWFVNQDFCGNNFSLFWRF